ncbi:hypothetical protein LBMAG21_07980 [Armatimonadota bacterium]|nr:hypothetical protein LBMAG21_07980 [Armatimonadota bacterium]
MRSLNTKFEAIPVPDGKGLPDSVLRYYQQRNFISRLGVCLLSASMLTTQFGSWAQTPSVTAKRQTKSTKPAPKKGTTKNVTPPSSIGAPMPLPPRRGVPPMPRPGTGLPIPPPGGLQPGSVTVAPPQPGGTPPAPQGTITFDYRGTDIMNVLKFFAQVSGYNITVDPGLAGQVTIINPRPVTVEEAFKVLQSVLFVRGFTAIRTDSVVSILPMDKGVRGTPTVSTELDKKGRPIIGTGTQVMTQVIPIENVDAEALAKELLPLTSVGASLIGSPGTNTLIITDMPSVIEKIAKLVSVLDKVSSNSLMKTYFLERADASAIAEIINNLYQKLTSRGKGGGAPQQPGMPPPPPGQPNAGGGRPAVVAVADSLTNSVTVVASEENQRQIAKDIIGKLDDEDHIALDYEVYKVQYSDAQDVANLVNQVLNNLRPQPSQGGGGGGNFGRFFGGFDPFGGGGGQQQSVSSTDPYAKVIADAHTNSLFITASADRMKKIKDLIKSIDVKVPTETTTFIFPLKNAAAQDVAEALNQALSTQQGNNGFGGGFFFGGFGGGGNRTNQRRQRINRRFNNQNNQNSNPFGRSAGAPAGPPNAPSGDNTDGNTANGGGTTTGSAIPQGVQGVMTPNGFVPTQGAGDSNGERTRQFYYDGGYGSRQKGLGTSRSPLYGRGQGGGYSNLLQLQNNVFVTPSPGGDSLIITTLPANYQALKDIIEKLDIVQTQVMIEVIIAEVTLTNDEKFGTALGGSLSRLFKGDNAGKFRMNLPGDGFGSAFDANANGGQFSIAGANYDALIQSLNNNSKVKVLATPQLFTTNNQEAEIEVTQKVPYITSQDSGIFGGNQVGQKVEYEYPGLYLNVIPSVTHDGQVSMDVLQEASELVRFDLLGTGISAIRAPVTNTRRVNTLVTALSNDTVVIGGLMRENNSLTTAKVPLLGDIPFFGQFFRSREKTKTRVELVIFMTPRVVSSTKEVREMMKTMSNHIRMEIPDLTKAEKRFAPSKEKEPSKSMEKKVDEKKEKVEPKTEEKSE